MRRARWIGVAAPGVLIAAALAVVWATREPPRLPNEPRETVREPVLERQKAIVFQEEGDAKPVLAALERIFQPGSVKLAVLSSGGARWVCVLTAGPTRGAALDEGLAAEAFPWIAEGWFAVPPADPGKSMSIIRSTVKSAIGYNHAKGDRIIVVTCPPQEWGSLRLTWPEGVQQP